MMNREYGTTMTEAIDLVSQSAPPKRISKARDKMGWDGPVGRIERRRVRELVDLSILKNEAGVDRVLEIRREIIVRLRRPHRYR